MLLHHISIPIYTLGIFLQNLTKKCRVLQVTFPLDDLLEALTEGEFREAEFALILSSSLPWCLSSAPEFSSQVGFLLHNVDATSTNIVIFDNSIPWYIIAYSTCRFSFQLYNNLRRYLLFYPHFIDEDTETLSSWITFSKSLSGKWQGHRAAWFYTARGLSYMCLVMLSTWFHTSFLFSLAATRDQQLGILLSRNKNREPYSLTLRN